MEVIIPKKLLGIIVIIMLCAGVSLTQDNQNLNFKDVALKGSKVQPVKITKFITNESKDDWLNGLTIEVENTSNKPIYYFRYAMVIRIENATPIGHQFIFNEELRKPPIMDERLLFESTNLQPLLPSEKTILSLPSNSSFYVKKLVEQRVPLSNVKKVDFILQIATYNDKTYWFGGNEFDSISNKKLD
jgi:hypothetical protein